MTPDRTLEATLQRDRGRLMAALIARCRDFALAEEALQDAALSALTHWRRGVPHNPTAWLLRVASRKAIDRLRHRSRGEAVTAALERLARDEAAEDPAEIPDERLRLIFTCCHPALEPKTQVALTLRTVCGLSTADIARAFLDSETAMGQRLSRAKAKIAQARIPYAVPGPELRPDRLNAVLTTVYLIFTTGYAAGPAEPRDLCAEAIFLMRLINALAPEEAEVEGALALLLLTHSRRAARVDGQGCSVPPKDQDRCLWDPATRAEGQALLLRAFGRHRPGPFQIKAAIADCHMADPVPDWPQIAALYDVLHAMEPTPVVALNRAVARAETGAEAGDTARALAEVEGLAGALDGYQPFHAARAALLARLGRFAESRAAYERAIEGAGSSEDARFLIKSRDALPR